MSTTTTKGTTMPSMIEPYRGVYRAVVTADSRIDLGLYPTIEAASRAIAHYDHLAAAHAYTSDAVAAFAKYRSAFAVDGPLANVDTNIDVFEWRIDRQQPAGNYAMGSG